MKWRNIFIIILINFFMASFLKPAESQNLLTLDESVEIAIKRSARLHASQEEKKGKEYKKKVARSEFLPKLSTRYNYTRLNESPHIKYSGFGDMEFGTDDNYNLSLNLTQPVFAGGALVTSYQQAKLGIEVAKQKIIEVKQELILMVKKSYFEILKSQKIRKVAIQAVEQLEEHLKVSQSFYDVGIIPKNDLLEAKVELAQVRQDLLRADNEVEIAKSYFNTVLRREINSPVIIEDILKYQPLTLSLKECISRAYEKRPELKEVDLYVKLAKREITLAKSKYYPDVFLYSSYERLGDDPSVRGNDFQDAETWKVMTEFKWTFWEWGKTKYEVNRNRTELAKTQDAKTQIKDNIALDVKKAYLDMKLAEKNIFVAKTAIDQAEENFRMNEERYKEQISTTTDVLDAQTLLTQARSNYYNALSDYNIAKARLEWAIGLTRE